MHPSLRATAKVVAVATALAAVPLTAAGALPILDPEGPGPVVVDPPPPPPTRPTFPLPPTGWPPIVVDPGPVALQLTGFDLSSDSVVGTARVRSTGDIRRVTVRWGDGTESTRPGVLGHIFDEGPITDATFRHRYAEPPGGAAFDVFVTASVESVDGTVDVEVLPLRITPRYRVTAFQTAFRPMETCESPFESTAEFDISQTVDGVRVGSWHREPGINIIPSTPSVLEGSAVSREMVAAAPSVNIVFSADEIDEWWDDDAGSVLVQLHPRLGDTSLALTSFADCEVEYLTDIDTELLVPIPPLDLPVFEPAP